LFKPHFSHFSYSVRWHTASFGSGMKIASAAPFWHLPVTGGLRAGATAGDGPWQVRCESRARHQPRRNLPEPEPAPNDRRVIQCTLALRHLAQPYSTTLVPPGCRNEHEGRWPITCRNEHEGRIPRNHRPARKDEEGPKTGPMIEGKSDSEKGSWLFKPRVFFQFEFFSLGL
jgi:hypothetical protein